jgi:hypothetical protein
MTAHLSGPVAVIRGSQDGWDWPNGVQDERWPASQAEPRAPYFAEQLQDKQGLCALKWCKCAAYSRDGKPAAWCSHSF